MDLSERVHESILDCPNCHKPLDARVINALGPQPCPECHTMLRVAAFPAALAGPVRGQSDNVTVEGTEASCFHHPDKQAVASCEHCGRFMCSLCDVGVRDRHFCPACLEEGIRSGTFPEWQSGYSRPDALAFAVACIPFMLMAPVVLFVLPFDTDIAFGLMMALLLVPTIVTAPVALWLASRYRRRVSAPWGRRRLLVWLAVLVGVGQLAVWGLALIMFFGALLFGARLT